MVAPDLHLDVWLLARCKDERWHCWILAKEKKAKKDEAVGWRLCSDNTKWWWASCWLFGTPLWLGIESAAVHTRWGTLFLDLGVTDRDSGPPCVQGEAPSGSRRRVPQPRPRFSDVLGNCCRPLPGWFPGLENGLKNRFNIGRFPRKPKNPVQIVFTDFW
jgi:hypothetical protein